MKTIIFAALIAALPSAVMAAPTIYPLVLDNCGIEARFDHAPQRAVGLGQNSTEIMLMLGLADRMAGSAIWVSPVLPELETENQKVERIAANTPNFEAVVARDPDFLAAQFLTSVGPKGRIGTREQFSDLGIPSYISPTDCATRDNTLSDGTRPQLLTMDLLYQEIDELSRIFDVADRGERLIADIKAREQAVRSRVAGRAGNVSLVYWFSSAEVASDAWVAGKNGASGYITSVLGAHSIIESEEEWPLVGWEAIAAKDPTVIVIGTMDRRTQAADDPQVKRKFLASDPVVSKLAAVEANHIIEMDAQAMNPTIRTITGLEIVADALEGFGLLK